VALFLFSYNSLSISVSYFIVSFRAPRHTVSGFLEVKRGEREVWLIGMFPKQKPKGEERKKIRK